MIPQFIYKTGPLLTPTIIKDNEILELYLDNFDNLNFHMMKFFKKVEKKTCRIGFQNVSNRISCFLI